MTLQGGEGSECRHMGEVGFGQIVIYGNF